MAIGVVAFALVAIAGTLPVGLQTMRDSQNDQASATIQSQLRGEFEQISFSTNATVPIRIENLSSSVNYYTVEGVKTVLNDPSLPAYYRAQFAVTNAGVNGRGYDGTDINKPQNSAVVTVILSSPAPVFAQTNRFSIFVTKQMGN